MKKTDYKNLIDLVELDCGCVMDGKTRELVGDPCGGIDGPCLSRAPRSFLVRIVREQVIMAASPQAAKEEYLRTLNAPTCVEVLEKLAGF